MTDIDHDIVLAESAWLDREDDGREPWVPEGLAFRVGDRVRVRINLECCEHAAAGVPLLARINGMTGTVTAVAVPAYPGHPIDVRFDAPFWRGDLDVSCGYFALSELIPLTADDEQAGEDDER